MHIVFSRQLHSEYQLSPPLLILNIKDLDFFPTKDIKLSMLDHLEHIPKRKY